MRRLQILHRIIFALFALSTVASVASAQSEVIGIFEEAPPPWLYHWIDKESLMQEWRVDALKSNGRIPLPNMKPNFLIANAAKSLAGKGGLFTWNHPVTGLGTGATEMYGDSVIMLKMSTKPVRILELQTESGYELKQKLDFKDFDMIHHVRMHQPNDGEKFVVWEEFIVTNNEIVEGFTADPALIKPRIRQQIKRLEAGMKYQTRALHFKVPGNKNFSKTLPMFNSRKDVDRRILPLLRQYMERPREEIPELWRRALSFGKCDELSEEDF